MFCRIWSLIEGACCGAWAEGLPLSGNEIDTDCSGTEAAGTEGISEFMYSSKNAATTRSNHSMSCS
jgi:hypothetical protein